MKMRIIYVAKCAVMITKAAVSTQATISKIWIGKCETITMYRCGSKECHSKKDK